MSYKIIYERMKDRRLVVKIVLFVVIIISIVTVSIICYRQTAANKKQAQAENIGKSLEATKNKNAVDVSDDNKVTIDSIDKHVGKDVNSYDAGAIQYFLTEKGAKSDDEKIVFLTFDDGPSTTVTPKILDVLKSNNVKATFFIVGSEIDKAPGAKKILLETYKQGNAIGNHTYTHIYKELYPNNTMDAEKFMADIEKNDAKIKSVLGQDFHTRVIRFPGGHNPKLKGMSKLDDILEDKGYKYVDWNTLTGDAEGRTKTKEELIDSFNKSFKRLKGKDKIIILMHDTYGKENTAAALPDIIKELKDKGYEFRTLK